MEASKRFDPAKGCKFSTYAVPWIRKYLWQALNDFKTTLRGVNLDMRGRPSSQSEESKESDGGRDASERISQDNSSTFSGAGVTSISDEASYQGFTQPDEALCRKDESEILSGAVRDSLSKQQQAVVKARNGLDGRERKSQGQVARTLGVSVRTVRNIEYAALAKLLETSPRELVQRLRLNKRKIGKPKAKNISSDS
jgi:RNA polymerase sigma factor (sigma-70 family)